MLTTSDLFRRTTNWNHRIVYLFLMVLFFSHLVITQGRSGYLTLLILSPLIARNLIGKFSTLKVLIVCLLLPAIMYLSPVVRQRIDRTVDEITFHFTTNPQEAWGKIYSHYQDRFYMWQYAVKIISEHPAIGVGTGGFKKAVKERASAGAPEIDHPHNDLIFLGVSFGALGILAYFWLYGTLFLNGWRYRHQLMARFISYVTLTMVFSGMLNGHMLDSGTAFLLALTAGLQQGLGIPNLPDEKQRDGVQ
jgi:O-antigen ligase